MKKKFLISTYLTAISILTFAQTKITLPIPNECSKFLISTFDTVSVISSKRSYAVISYSKRLGDSIVTSTVKDSMSFALNRFINDNGSQKLNGPKVRSSLKLYMKPNKRSLHFYFAPQSSISIAPLQCEKLFLEFNSSRNAKCNIGIVNSVFVNALSSDNIYIIGRAKFLSLNTESSKDINLSNLITENVMVSNNVGINIHVNAQKKLILIKNTVSRLKYKGNPKLHYTNSDLVEIKNGALEKE